MKPVGLSCCEDKRFYSAQLVLLASCVLCMYTQGGEHKYCCCRGYHSLPVQALCLRDFCSATLLQCSVFVSNGELCTNATTVLHQHYCKIINTTPVTVVGICFSQPKHVYFLLITWSKIKQLCPARHIGMIQKGLTSDSTAYIPNLACRPMQYCCTQLLLLGEHETKSLSVGCIVCATCVQPSACLVSVGRGTA